MTGGRDHYQFGQFRLDPEAGILYRGAEPSMLGQRAVALLRRLLETRAAERTSCTSMTAGGRER